MRTPPYLLSIISNGTAAAAALLVVALLVLCAVNTLVSVAAWARTVLTQRTIVDLVTDLKGFTYDNTKVVEALQGAVTCK